MHFSRTNGCPTCKTTPLASEGGSTLPLSEDLINRSFSQHAWHHPINCMPNRAVPNLNIQVEEKRCGFDPQLSLGWCSRNWPAFQMLNLRKSQLFSRTGRSNHTSVMKHDKKTCCIIRCHCHSCSWCCGFCSCSCSYSCSSCCCCCSSSSSCCTCPLAAAVVSSFSKLVA